MFNHRVNDAELNIQVPRYDPVVTDDVPWLSRDELASWIPFSAMLAALPAALDAQLKRDEGINVFEYYVMAALSESPDRSRRMSQLAMFPQGSLSRLSHAIGRLEKAGWVVRRPSREDPRATEAHLTAAGMRKVRHAAPGHVAEVRRLVLAPLSEDQLEGLGRIARDVLATTSPAVAAEIATRI
jgi:DNA-binding MarR family transcriptional regulator